ncbi:MAG: SDR family oxidoreductase, partial [Robiginitomaculum sp.]|nr:SDR family oxidoreductase [Robiginitomaculum sp.]
MTKTILITGAAARIGSVLAKGLASDGWRVVIHYNSSGGVAAALAAEIGNAAIMQADLTDANAVETLIDRAAEAIGAPLTALINNASTYVPDSAAEYDRDSLDNHLDVNLKAPLRLSQNFAHALPSGTNGCIINMIDQRVLRPIPDFFTYGVSKSALLAATQTMAQSFAPNIRVNAVGPGPTLRSVHQSEAEFSQECTNTLLGKGSPPETILDAVRYLLSATAVTGQMIAVDGGQH